MRGFVVVTSLLVACGQDGPDESNIPDSAETQSVPANEETPQMDTSVDSKSTDSNMETARLVADAASLPACSAENEGALAYIRAEGQFQACSSGHWSAIVIKGEKGDKGDAGEKGDKGDIGEPGPAGENGVNGTSTTWIDPITGRLWMIGSTGSWHTAQLACSGNFRLPSGEELLAAVWHGLASGFDYVNFERAYSTRAWASDLGDETNGVGVLNIGQDPYIAMQPKTGSSLIYCLSK